jgi:hypothetical protein
METKVQLYSMTMRLLLPIQSVALTEKGSEYSGRNREGMLSLNGKLLMKQTSPSIPQFGTIKTTLADLSWRRALATALLSLMPVTLFANQVVPIVPLTAAPLLDGMGEEWSELSAVEIPLRKTEADHRTEVDSIAVKGGVYQDRVYLYLTWKDATEDDEHKPFVWDEQMNRYLQSKALEDRVAIQFAMSGDYTTDWLSGNSFTADMWHWKAYRSNSVDLAHDKQTFISDKKLLRSYEGKSAQGSAIYILRPSDSGDRLYKSHRYRERVEERMPKYSVSPDPQGSIADIKAKGVWREGAWHLEISRQLNTGHADDVAFQVGQPVLGGIAVFNGTGDDDHTVSDTLIFQF